MVDTLIDKSPLWVTDDGPEAAIAISSRGRLVRNLADFTFSAHCSEEEKAAIEDRVKTVLDRMNLLASGRYCSLTQLDLQEAHLFAERYLIGPDMLEGTGPRGVYISDDQCLNISVNGEDHLAIQVICFMQKNPGLQFG